MGKSGAPGKALCVNSGGKAPRKALCVKKVVKKGAGTAKPQKKHAKAAALTTALMARSTSPTPPSSPTYKMHKTLAARIDVERADTEFDVFGSSDDSPSPTPPAPRSPRSPPHTPTYDREPWWDPVISLTRRMDAVAASLKDLQDRVKCLEDERVKLKAD